MPDRQAGHRLPSLPPLIVPVAHHSRLRHRLPRLQAQPAFLHAVDRPYAEREEADGPGDEAHEEEHQGQRDGDDPRGPRDPPHQNVRICHAKWDSIHVSRGSPRFT